MRGWLLLLCCVVEVAPLLACATPEPKASPPPPEAPVAEAAAPVAAEPSVGGPAVTNGLSEETLECGETAVSAARAALAAAISEGVAREHLEGCAPEGVRCEEERAPLRADERCQVVAYRRGDRWEIMVRPQPAADAPTRVEVWVDVDGALPGRVSVAGSTWGVVGDVRIEGLERRKSHTHGGPPARIGGAGFHVDNRGEAAVELELRRVRWLVAGQCELPREERATPKPAGIAREDGVIDGMMALTIPAGASTTIEIGHEVQSAYMAYCDRFATAAVFAVDGAEVEVIAEHRVIRRTPLRR